MTTVQMIFWVGLGIIVISLVAIAIFSGLTYVRFRKHAPLVETDTTLTRETVCLLKDKFDRVQELMTDLRTEGKTSSAPQTPPEPTKGNLIGPLTIAACLLLFGSAINYAAMIPGGYMSIRDLEAEVQAAWKTGDPVLIDSAISELAEAEPDNGLALHVQGLRLEREGHVEDAVELFKKNTDYGPSRVRLQRFTSP